MTVRILGIALLASLVSMILPSHSVMVSAAPGAAAQVTAQTPQQAVLRIIRPFYDQSAQHAACNPVTGKLAACPLTSRLRAAVARELQWERTHTKGGNGNVFCRCQNTPRRVVITGILRHPGKPEVTTVWYWGPGPVNINYVTVHVAGGWQIDNSYCAGYGPKTDLYHIPVRPCPTM
jgi:hypothetical protein